MSAEAQKAPFYIIFFTTGISIGQVEGASSLAEPAQDSLLQCFEAIHFTETPAQNQGKICGKLSEFNAHRAMVGAEDLRLDIGAFQTRAERGA